MRINEEFIETLLDDDVVTPVNNDVQISYDSVIMFVIQSQNKDVRILKMVDKIMKSSPDLERADVLPTEYDGNIKTMDVIAGLKRCKFRFVGTPELFYHLAYGLKGNLGNIRGMLRLITSISRFYNVITVASVFNMDDSDTEDGFRLSAVKAISEAKTGNIARLMREKLTHNSLEEFKLIIKNVSALCNKSQEDVLEVMMKFFNLTETYLEADNMTYGFEIARDVTDILRSLTPQHFVKFKEDVKDASFFESDNHQYNNYVRMYLHSLSDFFGNNRFLNTKVDIDDSAATFDIRFPQYATLGVCCYDNAWWKQEFEFVVPYEVISLGNVEIFMLVINVKKPEWMVEALSLLYPDLASEDRTRIYKQLTEMQHRQE